MSFKLLMQQSIRLFSSRRSQSPFYFIYFETDRSHSKKGNTAMSDQRSVNGAVALVTGANRGIGAAFVQGLLDGGARRVYAAARDPQALAALAQRDARVMAVTLDITDDASVRAAAQQLGDVN